MKMESEETFPVVSGIVGQFHAGEISNCYNTGKTTIETPLARNVKKWCYYRIL